MEKQIFIKRIPLQFDEKGNTIISYDEDKIKDEISSYPAKHESNVVHAKDVKKPLFAGICDGFWVMAFEIGEGYHGTLPLGGG